MTRDSSASSRHFLPHLERLWDAWAFAAVEVQLTCDTWKDAAREVKAAAYASYRAALDREEQAAAHLARARA